MNSDEYRILRLEIEPLKARIRELEEQIEKLGRRQSAMEDFLDVEWYDVPMRERYVKKEGYGRPD